MCITNCHHSTQLTVSTQSHTNMANKWGIVKTMFCDYNDFMTSGDE